MALIDVTGIADKMRVSHQRAGQIIDSKGSKFPEPAQMLRRRRLWDEADVDRWLDEHRPDWRNKTTGDA